MSETVFDKVGISFVCAKNSSAAYSASGNSPSQDSDLESLSRPNKSLQDSLEKDIVHAGHFLACCHGVRFLHELLTSKGVMDLLTTQAGQDQAVSSFQNSWAELQDIAKTLSHQLEEQRRFSVSSSSSSSSLPMDDAHLAILSLPLDTLITKLRWMLQVLEPERHAWQSNLQFLAQRYLLGDDAVKKIKTPTQSLSKVQRQWIKCPLRRRLDGVWREAWSQFTFPTVSCAPPSTAFER